MNRFCAIVCRVGIAFVTTLSTHSGFAQQNPSGPAPEESIPPPAEEILQALFESRDEATFEAASKAAREAGIAEQAILEARFLFLVDQEDFKAVGALAPSLRKQRASFRIDDSVIFSVPEEFFAIIEYCYALNALESGDLTRFRRHITEAFWLSPRQATAFAPHIDRLRRDRAIANLTVDLNETFRRQDNGGEISLKALAGNAKHLVVHFWSPWSNETEAHLPDFLAMVKTLEAHEIPVTSVLIEPGSEALAEARKFRDALPEKEIGSWIVDNSEASLARKLRVLDLPTITVLDVEGTILFSGHPSEKQLWSTLQQVNADLKRPLVESSP